MITLVTHHITHLITHQLHVITQLLRLLPFNPRAYARETKIQTTQTHALARVYIQSVTSVILSNIIYLIRNMKSNQPNMKRNQALEAPMWSITCGICKHQDDAEKFITSENNRYACPACGTVWRIERHGKPVVTESGFVIPPKKVCVVEPQMMLPTEMAQILHDNSWALYEVGNAIDQNHNNPR